MEQNFWKNGTFAVHSRAMTILINPSLQKWECMWTISRVTADSLRHADGTIAVLSATFKLMNISWDMNELQGCLFSLKSKQITSKSS